MYLAVYAAELSYHTITMFLDEGGYLWPDRVAHGKAGNIQSSLVSHYRISYKDHNGESNHYKIWSFDLVCPVSGGRTLYNPYIYYMIIT